MPPTQMPRRFEAASLSRMRSPVYVFFGRPPPCLAGVGSVKSETGFLVCALMRVYLERPMALEPIGKGLRGITLRYAHEVQSDRVFRRHPRHRAA
jgi:hypothetical protein